MSDKKVSANAIAAFLSAVAVAIREAGGRKEDYILRKLKGHLDEFQKEDSSLSETERAEMTVLHEALQKYRKNPLLARH